ncbi:MAG: L-seryl-tRNA(Sec) selenium transferase [Deltaproteobacteria bacterium]|nr:L-seryl-tRNA(Sec) selenium transferase [Deltaproteobacteria bacterium]
MTSDNQKLLKKIPQTDKLIQSAYKQDFFQNIPKNLVVSAIRKVTEDIRTAIINSEQKTKNAEHSQKNEKNNKITEKDIAQDSIIAKVKKLVIKKMSPNLKRVINGAGVVIHTNLGRSPLAQEAILSMVNIADRYSNLEFDLAKGKRGSRYQAVEELICEITGAEASMVVNNNAGAVLLTIETAASQKEVIVSRGELVEIGGMFRIPDIIEKSGGILKGVGTTNRTSIKDYEQAINENTALLLKVHKSNYDIIGFTKSASLKEVVELGKKYNICVMEDLGSGTFIDFSEFTMKYEPTVTDSVKAGADIITFSGDKLLGGPQAGIIIGKKDIIKSIRKNPLTRALRIDKLTLAALEGTLRLYRDKTEAVKKIPTLAMLTAPFELIRKKAEKLKRTVNSEKNSKVTVKLITLASKAGGGSLCSEELPSSCAGIKINGLTAGQIEKAMRGNNPPIIGRIENETFLIDFRTVAEDEITIVKEAVLKITKDLE